MKKFIEELKGLFSAHGLIALVLTSLAAGYVLFGFDLIPDSIMVIGYVDDVAVVLIAFWAGKALARMFLPEKTGKK